MYGECKICYGLVDVHKEHYLDGSPVNVCGKCRRYIQSLLRCCETCRDGKECARGYGFARDKFVCDEWKEKKS